MSDLIDFSKFAQTAMAFQNMQEAMRRNDLTEQHFGLEGQRLEEQRKKTEIDAKNASLSRVKTLHDLSNDPRVKSSPQVGDQVLAEALREAKFPNVSMDLIQRGRDYTRNMLHAMVSGDEEKASDAYIEMQVIAGPKDAETMVKGVADFQKMREYSDNVESMRQLQTARFEKVHNSMSRVNAGLVPLTQATAHFTLEMKDVDTPDFRRVLKMVEAVPKDKRTAALSGADKLIGPVGKSLASFSKEQMAARSEQSARIASTYLEKLQQDNETLALTENGLALPEGVTKRDLMERINVSSTLLDAYSDLATWQRTPFDSKLLAQAQKAQGIILEKHKSLEKLSSSASDEVIAIRRDAQSFRESEAGKKHTYDRNVMKAQAEALQKYGFAPPAQGIAEIASKWDVKVSDMNDALSDPAKKGKLDVAVNVAEPTKKVVGDLQTSVLDTQKTMRVVDTLIDTIDRKNVGLSAALKSTAFGMAGQVKGLAEGLSANIARDRRQDPERFKSFTPSKWFDPSIPTVDLLANTLAYRMINLEQGGRVSDEDVVQMKKRLNITSLLATKEDSLVRLREVKKQLEFEEQVNRRVIGKFGQERDSPSARGALEELGVKLPSQSLKPITEMSADEKLQELLQFQQQLKK